MNCNEIENRLPGYLEDLLSPEEQKSIAGHLASCPRCSRALADLKEAERLLHGLEEVEPPPFFEQRIMARVREEAERKRGILRRLFYPLHIKIPIQALATLLVAVLAFHVYQTGGPEMKQVAPVAIPVTELAKGQVTAESPGITVSPSAVAPVKQAPARDLSEKDRQLFAAPPSENGGKAERTADSRAPMREERPAAMKSAAPAMAAREKEGPPAGAVELSKMQEGVGKRDADQTLETFSTAQKRKEKPADTAAAAGENRKTIFAPSPSRLTAKAVINRSAVDLTVEVGDTAAAVREIEARLGQIHARIIESRHLKGSEFLKAEVPARNVAAFLKQLEEIGLVHMDKKPHVAQDEDVIVNIKIVGRP